MKDKKVRAIDILRMIPCEELAKLSLSTKIDYCAKALSGERVFYLLVYAFLAADEVSQRKLETVFNTDMFKTLFNISLDAKNNPRLHLNPFVKDRPDLLRESL